MTLVSRHTPFDFADCSWVNTCPWDSSRSIIIWHLCPLPVNNDVLHAMVVLPECTYVNDCTVVEFKEEEWFQIVLQQNNKIRKFVFIIHKYHSNSACLFDN